MSCVVCDDAPEAQTALDGTGSAAGCEGWEGTATVCGLRETVVGSGGRPSYTFCGFLRFPPARGWVLRGTRSVVRFLFLVASCLCVSPSSGYGRRPLWCNPRGRMIIRVPKRGPFAFGVPRPHSLPPPASAFCPPSSVLRGLSSVVCPPWQRRSRRVRRAAECEGSNGWTTEDGRRRTDDGSSPY